MTNRKLLFLVTYHFFVILAINSISTFVNLATFSPLLLSSITASTIIETAEYKVNTIFVQISSDVK